MAFLDDNQMEALAKVGQLLVERIRAKIIESGVNASGNLYDSIEYQVTADGLKILANGYFQYAEVGRKNGAIPRNFGDILEQWVKDKGISVPSQFKNEHEFGAAIAWKIAKEGSKRWRDKTPVDLIAEAITEADAEITDILGNYFVKTVNDNLPL